MGWQNDDGTPGQIADALEQGDFETARGLFKRDPELLRTEDGTDIWLWMAAAEGDLPQVQLLVDLGIGVNESNDTTMVKTAVASAAGNGHLEVVRWLLDQGAIINHIEQNRVRCSSLVYASMGGHLEVVKLLVERGADIHTSGHGMNALMHAQDYGQQEVVDYLRSLGVKDLRETTPPDYPLAHKLILNHMAEQFGPVSDWAAELSGDPVVMIRHIPAGSAKPKEQTLFTVGLSDLRLPSEWSEFACGELCLTLPADWPAPEIAEKDARWAWPFKWFKRIVSQLHQDVRWPATPVVFPNGDPPVPFDSSTELCCWMCLVVQGGSIQSPDCRWIDFHGLIPIYADETKLVQERGHEALVYRFQARELPSYLDPNRPNVAFDSDPEL